LFTSAPAIRTPAKVVVVAMAAPANAAKLGFEGFGLMRLDSFRGLPAAQNIAGDGGMTGKAPRFCGFWPGGGGM
jgi:hypothetical protein